MIYKKLSLSVETGWSRPCHDRAGKVINVIDVMTCFVFPHFMFLHPNIAVKAFNSSGTYVWQRWCWGRVWLVNVSIQSCSLWSPNCLLSFFISWCLSAQISLRSVGFWTRGWTFFPSSNLASFWRYPVLRLLWTSQGCLNLRNNRLCEWNIRQFTDWFNIQADILHCFQTQFKYSFHWSWRIFVQIQNSFQDFLVKHGELSVYPPAWSAMYWQMGWEKSIFGSKCRWLSESHFHFLPKLTVTAEQMLLKSTVPKSIEDPKFLFLFYAALWLYPHF